MRRYIIMYKQLPYNGFYFDSIEESRNYLKFQFPKRRFKEPIKDTFVCVLNGAKFTIIELTPKP